MAKVPDTPWHIGYIATDEDDLRRHRSRCKYFEKYHYIYKDKVKKSYCNKIKTNCFGSAHCDFYEEKQRFASTGIDDDSVLDPITDIVDCEREA